MKGIVLDASIAMTWCYPDEHSRLAYRVLEALEHRQATVPSLWPVEIANALVVGERRRRLSSSDILRFLDLTLGLPIEIDMQTASRALSATMQLSRTHGLSAYDAAYLELAIREGLVLATLDDRLKAAAAAAGVNAFV